MKGQSRYVPSYYTIYNMRPAHWLLPIKSCNLNSTYFCLRIQFNVVIVIRIILKIQFINQGMLHSSQLWMHENVPRHNGWWCDDAPIFWKRKVIILRKFYPLVPCSLMCIFVAQFKQLRSANFEKCAAVCLLYLGSASFRPISVLSSQKSVHHRRKCHPRKLHRPESRLAYGNKHIYW